MKTLVIGYGNRACSDDGVGAVVAEKIEKENWSGVEVRTAQQLQLELLEDFSSYRRIVMVDASASGRKVRLEKTRPQKTGIASSHHLSPGVLLGLAKLMDYKSPELYVCRIPGKEFGFGDQLSDRASEGAEKALCLIRELTRDGETDHA